MKVKNLGLFLLVSIILFGVISCKSTQPAVEPPPPQEDVLDPDLAPPSQSALDGLNAAILRTDNARKLVMDFDGPTYFPPEWGTAEGLYNQAQSQKKTNTVRDVRESQARYVSAAAAYEALAEKTIPRYADDMAAKGYAARDKAIVAGAVYWADDLLLECDNSALDTIALYEAKDYYKSRDAAFKTLDMYNALGEGVEALKLRVEIEEKDFVRYDPANIAAADDIAISALDDYDRQDFAAILTKAIDVRARYNQSLNKAKESYASDCAAAAAAERQRALDLKANVAVKQAYDAANDIFNQGAAASRARNFDNASSLYIQSRDLFIAVTADARERRRIAEEALREAEQKMVQSDETAQRAELIIEGGAR